MLTNVKWMKAAVRVTVATPLAATTASVLRAVDWGQMAKHVKVRWTSGCSWCAQTQTDCSRLLSRGFLCCFRSYSNVTMKMNVPGAKYVCYVFNHKVKNYFVL